MNQKSRPLARVVRLALAFALALGLLPLSAPARAQEAPAKARALRAAPQRAGFLVRYNGTEATCDAATPQELQGRFPGRGRVAGLRQINHLEDAGGGSAQTNLRIILRATAQLDANPTAKAAFVRAAANWEAVILSPITIVIDVDYGTTDFGDPFPQDVIGSTSGQVFGFTNNYGRLRDHFNVGASSAQEQSLYGALPGTNGVPTDLPPGNVSTVLMSTPALRAMGELYSAYDSAEDPFFTGDPSDPPGPPRIGFNSAIPFDFDPANGIGGSQVDFDAVATHEIGHVLGFDSMSGVYDEDPNFDDLITGFDIFRFPDTAVSLANFATKQRVLRTTATNTSQHYEFNGKNPAPLELSTGGVDGQRGDGEQSSHWKDRAPNTTIGIMDPRIQNGERNVIKAADLRSFDALGYRVNVDGGPTIPPPTPANDSFAAAKSLVSGSSGGENVNTQFATREDGEPNHYTNSQYPTGKSVWYKWTANGSGTARFHTTGSNFDTLLAVYQDNGGGNFGSLSVVGKNDDDPTAGGALSSRVEFQAVSGRTYYIAADGFFAGPAAGRLFFQWQVPGTPPPSTTLTVSASNVTVNEGTDTRIDLTVTRGGTTTGTTTVDYATSDGSARDGLDYLASIGKLTFAAGETTKTVSIFILDDAYGEPAETFRFDLSNPVGATLIAPSGTTVQINSNEAVNGGNPMRGATFNPDFFVRQQYLDFFNREADPGGLAFWTGQLNGCGTDVNCIQKQNVSGAFFVSIEFQTTGYFVYRTYAAALGRTRIGNTVPLTFREFLPDTQAIGRGVVIGQPGADQLIEANRVAFLNDFVSRPQFLNVYSTSMTPAAFVNALNANTNNSLSQAEVDAAVAEFGGAGNISDAAARARALRKVAEDTDFANLEKNRAYVLMQYFGYLRRNPPDPPELTLDYQGYNFWLQKLNDFGGNAVAAEMIKAFITSEEYKLRFGP